MHFKWEYLFLVSHPIPFSQQVTDCSPVFIPGAHQDKNCRTYDLAVIAEHLRWVKSHSLLGALKRFRNTDKGTPLTKEQFEKQLMLERLKTS